MTENKFLMALNCERHHCFAVEGGPDAVETIANAYVKLQRHREGLIRQAHSYLFEARDIVAFGIDYLERNFGRP